MLDLLIEIKRQVRNLLKSKINSNEIIAFCYAFFDQNLVGKWVNEQIYNSGSGDSFFGGTTTQSLIFYADGSLSDGGSSTTVSGSNYYGSSSDKGASPAIPNVSWYAQNQHIFIKDAVSGQTVDLGKYYIENGALLITGNNGKKLLFRKK